MCSVFTGYSCIGANLISPSLFYELLKIWITISLKLWFHPLAASKLDSPNNKYPDSNILKFGICLSDAWIKLTDGKRRYFCNITCDWVLKTDWAWNRVLRNVCNVVTRIEMFSWSVRLWNKKMLCTWLTITILHVQECKAQCKEHWMSRCENKY